MLSRVGSTASLLVLLRTAHYQAWVVVMIGRKHTTQRSPINTLLKSTLADGGHEAGITLWQSGLIVQAPRAIRVDGLVDTAVELEQVLEDLSCS